MDTEREACEVQEIKLWQIHGTPCHPNLLAHTHTYTHLNVDLVSFSCFYSSSRPLLEELASAKAFLRCAKSHQCVNI